MKKFAFLFALVLALAFAGHAQAQDKMSGGKMSDSKMSGGKVVTGPTQNITGTIKGTPSGKTFILARKKQSDIHVDASKAKIRVNGKFAKVDAIKSDQAVTVVGRMVGTSFMADTVNVAPVMKQAPPSIGKMGKVK